MLGIFMKFGGGAKINNWSPSWKYFSLCQGSLYFPFFSFFCHIFLICDLYSSASILYYFPCTYFYSFKNQSQERFQWSHSHQTQRSFLSSHFLTAVELLPLLTTPFFLKASRSPDFKYMRYHQSLILLLLPILMIIPRQIHLPLIPRLLLCEYTNMNKTDSGESHHLEEARWFICCGKRG